MKKNKGFTLIEIMAVIVILAVIALIVVPLVTGSIKDSKQKLYETQLENIKSGAKSYMINLDLPNKEPITITLDDLQKKGLVDKDIKNPITDEKFNKCMLIQIKKTSDKEDIYEYEIMDEINDCSENGDIIMALRGSVNEEVMYQKPYEEPGIILETTKGDKIDLSEVKVEVEKYLDGVKQGNTILGDYNKLSTLIDTTTNYYEYKIKYIYEGEKGKASVNRNVKVKEASNLGCVILTGKKNANGWITENNEARILKINTNADVEYSISTSGKENYGTNQTIKVDDGEGITIYGAIRDKKGNKAYCNALDLNYEIGGPSCRIELDGKKGVGEWYIGSVKANMVPLLISGKESQGMSLNNIVNYNGQAQITLTNSGNVYGFVKDKAGKSTTCSESAKIDSTTTVLVTITGVLEGTKGTYTSGTTVSENVILQATVKPGTTVSGYKYQWYKDNVAISGATNATYTATSNGNYKVVVTTGSGVTGVSNTINVKIETARPTCSLKVNSGTSGENGWYTSNVVVGMTTKDATYYGTNSSYNMQTSQTLSASGTAYCYVANSTKTTTNSNSMQVKIDKTGPTVSLTAMFIEETPYEAESFKLIAKASDPESGIARYEFYRVDQEYSQETLLGSGESNTFDVVNADNKATNYKVVVYNKAGLSSTSTIVESCSIQDNGSCNGSTKTIKYACTGTGRTWTSIETCSLPPSTGDSSGGSSSGSGSQWTTVVHDGGNCKVTVTCPTPGVINGSCTTSCI
ncbi:MAG: prepilin-type N-terminal cleavage/methylation domain-containing protein [Bacilli bacterium]|nr:prepilin-type N-terminal cleavage/methylation domain-containing protein [Bacilli bacterium]